MAAVIELEGLPATDRVDILREHMLTARIPLELRPYPGLDIRVRSFVADFGDIQLLSVRAAGGQIERTARLAQDASIPSLLISVVESGTTLLAQAGRVARLRAGDMVLYTSSEPYVIRFAPGTVRLTYQVPIDRLGLPRRLIRSRVARALDPHETLVSVTSAFLARAASVARGASAEERVALQQPIIELVRALLTVSVADERPGRDALGSSLGVRMAEYLEARISDSDLSAASIAAEFGISERYVYLVLSRMGISLGDWVRTRRLELAAAALAKDTSGLLSISSVAYRWGFADHAHFSRAFRAHLGMTPTEWRRQSANQGTR